MNITNNLFNYATSELSQDAFICYLASFAIKGNDNNKILYKCAIEFINMMLPNDCKLKEGEYLDESDKIKPICKQYKCIDVLLHAKDYSIIIEDKTYTGVHDDQISRYEKALINDGVDKNKIRKIYYKIIEQSSKEDVDFEFNRKNVLELLKKYVDNCNNKIITDYYDYLTYVDNSVNNFKSLEIANWDYYCYIGFFNYIINEGIVKSCDDFQTGYSYVANPTGGFMGCWWTPINIKYIYDNYKSNFYLQIENDKLVLKVYNDDVDENIEQKRNNEFKYKLIEHIIKYDSNIELVKRICINHTTVSICYTKFNEKSYRKKIEYMCNLLLDIKNCFD